MKPVDRALVVYRVRAGQPSEVLGQTLSAADELAFAYRNLLHKRFLFVFAVDEHRHVYWYHPEWRAGSAPPTGVAIAGDDALHELQEAIAQPIDGRELALHALFTDRPLTTEVVESILVQDKKAWPGVLFGPLRVSVER